MEEVSQSQRSTFAWLTYIRGNVSYTLSGQEILKFITSKSNREIDQLIELIADTAIIENAVERIRAGKSEKAIRIPENWLDSVVRAALARLSELKFTIRAVSEMVDELKSRKTPHI